jgi:hypothetical protein
VSEVKEWILPDLVHYTMDMEQSLQQMMEPLLARQTEEMKAGQEEIKARQEKGDTKAKPRQDKADANAKAHQAQFKEVITSHMEDLLEGLRSCGKRATAYLVSSVACPKKLKAGSEGTEAAVPLKEVRTKWRPQTCRLL